MSSSRPEQYVPGQTPGAVAVGTDGPNLPQRQGMRLHQILDVSSAPKQEGDSLVYKEDSGMWEPIHLPTGPGEVITSMLADESVTTPKLATDAVTQIKMANNSVGTAELIDNNVTDAKIGDRIVTDIATLTSNTGTITQGLSRLATMVKAITGKASWLTLPAITLEALNLHAARHATGGADPITPTSIGASASTHIHPNATTADNGFMSSSSVTKLNTIQTSAAAVASSGIPDALDIGQSGSLGTSSVAARSDHRHALPGMATTSNSGFMSSTDKTKLDNATEVSSSTPDALDIGQTGATGTSSFAARSDHRHALPGYATTSVGGFLSAADKVKIGSIPTLSDSDPDVLSIDQTGDPGGSSQASRADHKHDMPGLATSSISGFMSASDKGKLDDLITPKYYVDTPGSDFTLPASTGNSDLMSIALSSAETGYYFVVATVDLEWNESDDAIRFQGKMYFNTSSGGSSGSPQGSWMIAMSTAVPMRMTITQHWIVYHSTSVSRYIYFNVSKSGAGGSTSKIWKANTSLSAFKIA